MLCGWIVPIFFNLSGIRIRTLNCKSSLDAEIRIVDCINGVIAFFLYTYRYSLSLCCHAKLQFTESAIDVSEHRLDRVCPCNCQEAYDKK